MKKYSVLAPVIGLIAVSFAFVGFQCSSAELTSAKLYMQKNEWDKAETELEKDLGSDSLDVEAWYYLGIVRGEQKNYVGLLDAFAHASKISNVHDKDIQEVRRHYWVINYNAGSQDLQKGRDTSSYYETAVKAFNATVMLEPDSTVGYRGLAYAYLNMGKTDSAIAPLKVLWNREEDQDAAKFLGEIYYEKGRSLKQEFEDQNSDKIKIAEDIESIKTGMTGTDLISAVGKPDEKTVQKAVVERRRGKMVVKEPARDIWVYKTYGLTIAFENDTLASERKDFEYNAGIDSTKYKLAVTEFIKGLDILKPASQKYPNDSNIMTILTNCYIGADMTQEAAEAFKLAAEQNPDNKDFQYNYGVILLRGDNYEQAINQFQKTLKIDPEYWNAVYNMGASYVNWGVQIQTNASANSDPDSLRGAISSKFGLALPYLEKYSSYKATDPNIWELLGKVYAYLNEVQKAQDAMQKADSLRQIH